MKRTILPAVFMGVLSSNLMLAADDVVLMSYFRDNGNAGTFLCVSEDGLKFRPLNNDKPILPPGKWPGQGRTRDPSILYHDGKFRLVWTTNWTGRVFGYAESEDLVKWSEPVLVSPFPEESDPRDLPKSVWAPEIHWDPLQKNYLILWSSNTPRLGGFRTFATRTTDGKTFTPAKLFFDPGIAAIDAQMLLVPSYPNGPQWLMVVKDERAIKEGGKALHLTTAPLDFSQPWTPLSPSVIGPRSTVRPGEMVEGGCLLKVGGEYRLYCDAFASKHYSVAKSPDLKTWTDLTPQLDLPKGVRHGTVFTAPRAAVGWLKAADVSGGQAPKNSSSDMETIHVPIAEGPCQPDWKSLGDHFKTPAWWRNARIGMWLHWGPQALGREGDWYAKWIYMPKYAHGRYAGVYQSHLRQYGHPDDFGYKDMLPLWKAEKWNPEKLMALYKRAGARYVIAQGMHHDNFDLWDSKYQPWNSVNLGPKRSIVGDWKKAADQHGMKFGIAFHGDYSLWWYQPAFLSDLEGPKRGVPYDGARNYDGQETWWKKMGLDLKDLYGIDLKKEVTVPADWKDGETAYRMKGALSHGIPNGNLRHHRDFATWYATKWTRRVIDAIDQFSPDFIYFDGGRSYPFCGAGTGKGLRADATPRVIAHLYNSNMARNGGKLEAMAFTKGNEDPRAVAVNVESGVPKGIKRDQPWQSENTIGEWFYKTGIRYDSGKVIRQMLNAVCRDGNYAVNVPLTPEGELDPGGLKTLQDMGDWMEINGEGIYDSSAWDIWGESASGQSAGGGDFRFTTINGAVYAYLLAWPGEPKTTIRALGARAGQISKVEMLGFKEPLKWEQTPQGLVIHLPAEKPCQFAYGLKITGTNLHPAPGKTPPTGK